MNHFQLEKLIDMLVLTAEICGTDLKATAAALMAKDLEDYELSLIEKALTKVRRENKGRLSLAAIIECIDDPKAPMGVDQAWAFAVAARIWDEEATLVIPRAILQAFPLALWNTGDKVAARMAFKDAYPKCLAECGDEVLVSLGWDAEGRRSAIDEAVMNGVITQARASKLLPKPVVIADPEGHKMIAKVASSTL